MIRQTKGKSDIFDHKIHFFSGFQTTIWKPDHLTNRQVWIIFIPYLFSIFATQSVWGTQFSSFCGLFWLKNWVPPQGFNQLLELQKRPFCIFFLLFSQKGWLEKLFENGQKVAPHWLVLVFLYAFFIQWSILPTNRSFLPHPSPPPTHTFWAFRATSVSMALKLITLKYIQVTSNSELLALYFSSSLVNIREPGKWTIYRLKVQNVRYFNSPPSHETWPFKYRTHIMSGFQVFS